MYGIYYTKKPATVLLCNVFTKNALLLSYYVLFYEDALLPIVLL
jgi:hypothetical protein